MFYNSSWCLFSSGGVVDDESMDVDEEGGTGGQSDEEMDENARNEKM